MSSTYDDMKVDAQGYPEALKRKVRLDTSYGVSSMYESFSCHAYLDLNDDTAEHIDENGEVTFGSRVIGVSVSGFKVGKRQSRVRMRDYFVTYEKQ